MFLCWIQYYCQVIWWGSKTEYTIFISLKLKLENVFMLNSILLSGNLMGEQNGIYDIYFSKTKTGKCFYVEFNITVR